MKFVILENYSGALFVSNAFASEGTRPRKVPETCLASGPLDKRKLVAKTQQKSAFGLGLSP